MTQTVDHRNWALERSPFSGDPQRGLFFEGASAREALARLRFVQANGKLGLLSGPAGCGKSCLMQNFAQQSRQDSHTVALFSLQGISSREFYWEIGLQWRSNLPLEDDLPRLFRRIADTLVEQSLQGGSCLLLVDDVALAGQDVISQLIRLVKLKESQQLPLSMVLVSNNESLSQLPSILTELVDLRVELEPWDELDTIGYLQLALVEAGCIQPLFDDASLAEIHHLANGVPRDVKRLADAALLLGSATAPEIIDTETVKAAHQRLSPSGEKC